MLQSRTTALAQIDKIRETCDIKEVAQLLNSGDWIAICATDEEPYWFSLGRLRQQPLNVQAHK